MRVLSAVVMLLVACGPGKISLDGTDSGDTGAKPSMDAPTDVSVRLHDDIASIAYVSWTQAGAATSWVEYGVDGEETRSTPAVERAAGTYEQIVVGLPYDAAFTVRVVVAAGGAEGRSEPVASSTGPVPDEMPVPDLLVADPDRYEPSGVFLLGSVNRRAVGWSQGEYWKFVLDRQGRLVWAMETPEQHWTLYMQPSVDGRALLWDEATYWAEWDGGEDSQVHRMTLDGAVEETYDTPGLHHSFTQLPDGALVWGAATGSGRQEWEDLVERAPDGTMRTIWSCEEFHAQAGAGEREDCQSNSIWYTEANDTFLFSFYTTNTIVEIDHATGESLRWWGDLNDEWAFVPPDSQFAWQHGPSWTPEGHLLVSSEHDQETVVFEYVVDDASRTLTEVWSFGVGEDVYGSTNGEAHRLANGNTLHNIGASGRLREVTSQGDVVWDVGFGDGRLLGRSILVDDLYAFAEPSAF